MKNWIFPALACLVLAACSNDKPAEKKAEQNLDASFNSYKERFVELLWKVYPGWASGQGYHKYDSVLVVPDEKAREKELAFASSQLDSLKAFDLDRLSDNNKTDHRMMANQLNGIVWSIRDMRSFEWNPAEYNVSGAFAEILNGTYAPSDQRLRSFYRKMTNIPAYYEAARKNIKNPTIEHTQLAIDQNLGGISVFEKDFPDSLRKAGFGEEEKQAMQSAAKQAVKAIRDFADWLKALENKSPRSFRLGEDLYADKFEYDIVSGYTAGQVYEKALKNKEELHRKMYDLTTQLWEKYFGKKNMPDDKLETIRMMIDHLSAKHVQPDSFQSAIEKQIPLLVEFIRKKDLIYIDPSKPLVVRKEPAYMAGVAGASISAPGPYDKNANTYYNVGSLSGWSKEQSESYLREYNHYILQILNIHEAIPGHYTQLVYSNQSPSIIKAIFGNGAMIEGWAVYTERMMLENGYGNNEPEMWLMYYKWNLRTTCNTILDYSVHTKDMSREEALNLLTHEAFQQQAEAEGKWRRVTLTQVQLCSYFTGYTEIYDFREELKTELGDKFSLKAFHEKFLSYGSAPVKYIRELMLKEHGE